MTAVLSAIFAQGVILSRRQHFMLMLPLCLSIAVVYKTTRCRRLRDMPAAALALWVTIVAGVCSVGFGLWAVFTILV